MNSAEAKRGQALKYQRILLKISGEMLAGSLKSGIDLEAIRYLADQAVEVHRLGVEIGIVVGGGNIFRGSRAEGETLDRVSADQMGMLATVINSLALQDVLEKRGCFTRVMTAIPMQSVAEPYIRRRAIRHIEKGRIVLFAAGTGNPYFTTDTAAALRAIEIKAEVILKGTKVDGVYNADPVLHPEARRAMQLTYMQVLEQELAVMDATAISLCKENCLPLIVFSLQEEGSLRRIVLGDQVGTLISCGEGRPEHG